MALKPVSWRSDPSDLDAARKIVSRAERHALENAEELREQADELLKLVARRTVDADLKVRTEYESELAGLRQELDAVSRRATIAENELELLRAHPTTESGDHEGQVPPLQVLSEDEHPPIAAATAAATAAARLRSQAELEYARAKEEAVLILSAATREAENLLVGAISAIEHDSTIAVETRQQAQQDSDAVAALRQELQSALGKAAEEAARIREDGLLTRDRLVEEATAKSARLVESAEAESLRIRDDAMVQLSAQLDQARAEAERVVTEGRRDAAEALMAVRRRLIAEILGLRDAMDRTRESFDLFLESSEASDARPDRVAGDR